ncbi:hypothetical protein GBAR_LOCUS23928 [Geodia barretti]|uniref:Uncharacterized protein n=1 Tax=Geodia barretti TaxID=519541 RepID=A0AA35X852_GEOBA|nr:hypothetical protein GBAR_LOCUS23928 [Geodia barretti]
MMATVHTGSNDREHPNSSPIGSPRPPHSPMPHSPMPHSPMPHSPMPHSHAPFTDAPFTNAPFTNALFIDAPFTNAPFTNAPFIDAPFPDALWHVPFECRPNEFQVDSVKHAPCSQDTASPVLSPQRLECPPGFMHYRRPSDEAAIILRNYTFNCLMPDKTMSLPMYGRMAPLSPAESLSPHEHLSYPGTDLSETGRMLSTALSDGYLTMHDTHSDLSPHHHQLSASLDGRHFGQALNDTLFPPLTQNDRHPSAPQLVSMLTDNKADVMLQDDVVGPL